jgi:hypothetical protein
MSISNLKSSSLLLVDAPLPTELLSNIAVGDLGKGLATQAEAYDRTQMKVLQPLSPPLDANDPFYDPQAKAGDFHISGVFTRASIQAIFVQQSACWIEWGEGRTGFVGRHSERPVEAQQVDTGKWRPDWVLPNGNNVVQTTECYGLFDGVPAMFSCTSSFLQFARTLQTLFASHRHPGPDPDKKGKPLPSFICKYTLQTYQKTNARGKWYMPITRGSSFVTPEEYGHAKAFYQILTGAA